MSYARYDFIVAGLSVTVALLVLSAALATGTSAFYRSVLLQKEIATRRVLGARRAHIVTMFFLETIAAISIGLLLGAAVVVFAGLLFSVRFTGTSILISALMMLCSSAIGTWLAARHAANTPFRKSGLFSAASDRRGE